jgi:hypothetical protein
MNETTADPVNWPSRKKAFSLRSLRVSLRTTTELTTLTLPLPMRVNPVAQLMNL